MPSQLQHLPKRGAYGRLLRLYTTGLDVRGCPSNSPKSGILNRTLHTSIISGIVILNSSGMTIIVMEVVDRE